MKPLPAGSAVCSWRVEEQLLAACARAALGTTLPVSLTSLALQVTDWRYLLDLAQWHGLAPLMHRALEPCWGSIPLDVEEEVRVTYQHNLVNNLFLTGKLFELLALFEQEGIAVIPFKGPLLAATAYGHLGDRRFVDLDVLIHQCDVQRARCVLKAAGYLQRDEGSEADEQKRLKRGYHCGFMHPQQGVKIELHWHFTLAHFPFAIDLERLWADSSTVQLAGKPVPSLASEDLLLILAVHGSKHFWSRFSLIVDLAAFVCKETSLNWDSVASSAVELGCERMLLLALHLAQALLAVPLAPTMTSRIAQEVALERLATEVTSSLFHPEAIPSGALQEHDYYLRLRERLGDRLPLYGHLAGLTFSHAWKLGGRLSSLPQAFWRRVAKPSDG